MMLLAGAMSRAMKEVIAEFLFVTIFRDEISAVSHLSQQFMSCWMSNAMETPES